MHPKPPTPQFQKPKPFPFQLRKQGHPVSKATLVAGRRIAGSQRAEQARQQKRRDSKR